jgi:hypothetical protein
MSPAVLSRRGKRSGKGRSENEYLRALLPRRGNKNILLAVRLTASDHPNKVANARKGDGAHELM